MAVYKEFSFRSILRTDEILYFTVTGCGSGRRIPFFLKLCGVLQIAPINLPHYPFLYNQGCHFDRVRLFVPPNRRKIPPFSLHFPDFFFLRLNGYAQADFLYQIPELNGLNLLKSVFSGIKFAGSIRDDRFQREDFRWKYL